VLLDAAIKGAALLSAAGVLVLAMHKASAAGRQMVWLLALAALLALPLASASLPAWQVLPGWARIDAPTELASPSSVHSAGPFGGAEPADVPPPPAAASESLQARAPALDDVGEQPTGAPPAPVGAVNADIQASPPSAAPAATAAPAPTIDQTWRSSPVPLAVAIWLAGLVVCLVPLALGRLSLWQLGRRSRRVDSGSWATLMRRAATAVGLRRHVQLLQSRDEPMPMVWGVFRSRLLLPAEADTWPAERRWVVLLHELAHAKRHDCLAKLVAHAACAVYWFNPLAWIAFKLMQREAETACDDLVLSASVAHPPSGVDSCATAQPGAAVPQMTIRPSDYAQHLLEIASGLKSGMLAAYSSIAMARKSKLEGRLLAILDARRRRRRAGRH
jgi:hypothetical protein